MLLGQPAPDDLRVDVAVDGDEFMMSVPGAGGALVRTGRGSGATRVAAQSVSSGHLAVLEFGFPMVGTAHSEGDHLIVCHMMQTPPGGRWDGTDLVVGQSFVYPPGSMQVATDPEGLRFGMVVVPWAEVERGADALGYDAEPAVRPHVRGRPADGSLGELFAGIAPGGEESSPGGHAVGLDELVEAAVRAACDVTDSGRRRRDRWDSQDLVVEVEEWLAAGDRWQVPMLSLCRQVGVSERRLQLAFREAYDTTPRAFMRMRALQAAHRTLRSARPGSVTVATVAAAHGFAHRSRFAAVHESVYGMTPSRVLGRP